MENNIEPTVHAAANVFRDICYNYREQLKAAIICAGWDEKNGGQVYCVPLGGVLVREPVTIGGSGSSYIYGYVDKEFKEGMSESECVDFVLNAVTLALTRDGSSGGCVRIGIIDKNGCRKKCFLNNELPAFYQG
jgi:20S proteasome subunit beta 1